MAAVAIRHTERSEDAGRRNVLLRLLDSVAEWLMRQELRIISRGRDVV